MYVTVRAEWDMGHRLPNHDGECRNLHGHRYAAEVTVGGGLADRPNDPQEGMLLDFVHVKRAIRAEILRLDHRFLLCDRDPLLGTCVGLAELPGVVEVPYVPTAENIAAALLCAVTAVLDREPAAKGVTVRCVRVYETPTSWADATTNDL